MRKRILVFLGLFLIFVFSYGNVHRAPMNFLAAAVSCGTTTTLTNGTDFTSREIRVSYQNDPDLALITVTFTRTTGSAAKVYFDFQVSYDGGTTWSTAYFQRVEIATNELAVSNVVRYSEMIPLYGISHIRLYRIINNDAGVALTVCNATLSI